MIVIEQRLLEPLPAIRVPEHRHHIGEIVGRGADAPILPIQQSRGLVATRPRQEEIPGMRVAMDDGQVTPRIVTREQLGRTFEKPRIKCAPLGRQYFGIALGEAFNGSGEFAEPDGVVGPPSQCDAEARIIPAHPVNASECPHHLLAMRHRRRQRPLGRDEMRVGEVFEREMPCPIVRRVDRLEAARHQALRQGRSNVAVEGDLVRVPVSRTAGIVEMPHLEND
jgi:hypothetical protein